MLTEDLARLKELDLAVYTAWHLMIDVYGVREGCIMSDAALQHCLQEAIAARGWHWNVSNDDEEYWGCIHNTGCLLSMEDGDSPAAALLAAYTAALEAQG